MCGVRRQAMQERSLDKRVDLVEKKMEALETLPDRVTRVELQLVHLRDDIRAGDEETRRVLREEIRAGDEETRRVLREEIRAGDEETRRVLREEIRAGDEETRRALRDEIRSGDEETRRVLRDEIRSGDDETRRYMRVLHEDVIARLATIQEGRRPRKKR
jgi:hypothetical protein